MYSNDAKIDTILIYGECNKNTSAIARLCRQFSQKLFRFSQFHSTRRLMFMSNLRNCTANYVLCFLNQKTNIHVNCANVFWVAFSICRAHYHS
jgi:hypothetical protein